MNAYQTLMKGLIRQKIRAQRDNRSEAEIAPITTLLNDWDKRPEAARREAKRINGGRKMDPLKQSRRLFHILLPPFFCLLQSLFATDPRPNVLFIMVDDLRTSLGCYGDTLVKSPNIDLLAQSSQLFQRAYCHQSVCGPSRTSILTGRLPDNTGVWHNRNRFRTNHPDLVTLPQLFKNNGYHAQGLGKIFSGDERELDPVSWSAPEILKQPGWRNDLGKGAGDGKGAPFESADVPDDAYPDGKLANLAIETLAQFQSQSQPFFLAVGFFKPHLPFNAPKKYWDLYDPSAFALNDQRTRTQGAPDFAYPDHLELAGYRGIPDDERVTPEQARQLRHGYYACISYTDAQIGKLLAALKQQGLDDNTIVVLIGDHGYSLGEADHWCKDTNFELDTHVPLMIRAPGMTPGTAQALTEYVDLYPTLADLAQLTPPAGLDGRSLVPVLKDAAAKGREFVLSQFSRPFRAGHPEIMGYSIRTESQRYTRWIEWTTRKVLSEELYDYTVAASVVKQDGFLIERENLASNPAHASKREQLSQQMDELIRTRLKPKKLEDTAKKPKKKKKKA
jgi:iduronate 2-sulfatase